MSTAREQFSVTSGASQSNFPLLATAFLLAPLAVASLPLLWFTSGTGVRWAYSIWNTAHPLNLGGNPSEVLSHLLNGIVMVGSMGSLCAVLLSALWMRGSQSGPASHPAIRKPLRMALVASVLAISGWAVYLDSRFGEGTVLVAFIILFGPAIALCFLAARRLISAQASRPVRTLAVILLFAISVGMFWVYEPSGSGGPNLLAFPLLGIQVGLFWFASRWLVKRATTGAARIL